MIKANPVQIQHKGQGSTAVPLVLIHDGGGTIYSYLNLGQLHRDVYAIFNPHFDDGSPWMGGIPEMAQEYAKMIRAKIGRGPIILGGWSLGGMLSLEISYVLASDPDIQVIGLLLIDSHHPPKSGDVETPGLDSSNDQSEPTTGLDVTAKVVRCFQETQKMIGKWSVPSFEPPFGVLMRASEDLVIGDADPHRDRMLGWSEYENPFLKTIIDIPGNHFTLFNPEHCGILTTHFDKSCRFLETEFRKSSNS